ncbi:MAG: hypothetical protein K2O70_04775 [Desulfovibrionaceae bacterium]|nr:hypothetical protein [Desulfovibrionaceae bacterium]
MNAISKPSADDLAPLLAEGTKNGTISEDVWRTNLLSGIASLLTKNPLHYRCFGPYWWLVKNMLREQDEGTRFGDNMDAEWKEKMDYGSPTLNLLAAFAYYDMAFNKGLLLSHTHSISYEDGESADYVLIDEDMETQAIAGA